MGCATDTSEMAALFGDETVVYADTRHGDRIARLDMLCTGYRPESDGD